MISVGNRETEIMRDIRLVTASGSTEGTIETLKRIYLTAEDVDNKTKRKTCLFITKNATFRVVCRSKILAVQEHANASGRSARRSW